MQSTERVPQTTTAEIYQGLSGTVTGLIVTVTVLVVIIAVIITVVACKKSNRIWPSDNNRILEHVPNVPNAPSLSNFSRTQFDTHLNEPWRRQTNRSIDDPPPAYNEVIPNYENRHYSILGNIPTDPNIY